MNFKFRNVGIINIYELFNLSKKDKAKIIGFLTSWFLSFIVFGLTAPDSPLNLALDRHVIYTDHLGQALLSGEVNADAELLIDGIPISILSDGYFEQELQLEGLEEKVVSIVATLNSTEQYEEVIIKPSNDYMTYLQEQLENERIALAEEKALVAISLAEAEPNRENYDVAYSMVSSLTRENSEFDQRLNEVLFNIEQQEQVAKALSEATEAVKVASTNPTRANYDHAFALVEHLSNEENELVNELKEVLQVVEQQEREQQVRQSESEVSDTSETSYVDANGNGLIKGSSSGIYHIPGSTYYDRTTRPVSWFKTVSEAEAAGYRAPKR